MNEYRRLEPIVDALVRHRRLLIGLYLVLLVWAWLASIAISGDVIDFDLHWLIPDPRRLGESDLGLGVMVPALFIFVSVQALFLWGGGRIAIADHPSGPWRLLLPVAIAAVVMLALVVGLTMTALEMVDRLEGAGTVRQGFGLPSFFPANWWSNEWIGVEAVAFLILVWSFWFALGIYMLRKSDQQTALSRLAGVLLAGSWIEFLAALPVDIGIRQRAEDCPCQTGSWMALVIAIPAFLFAFGPGIVLLYLRELRLAQAQPKRAWRILVRKSRKRTADGK